MTDQKVYGRKACMALLNSRPHDVVRLYHAPALRDELSGILPWLAARRLPYRELDEEGLRKVADGPHHEGIVVAAQPLLYRSWPPPDLLEESHGGKEKALWLALDGVTNPHNLGAMLRTSAFYGVAGVLLGGTEPGEKVNAAVLRVAEGGAEWVPLFAAPKLPSALIDLHQAGLGVIGLETDGRATLELATESGMTAEGTVIVLGQEQSGLSLQVRQACGALCSLEGPGRLDSLNVSVAAGVALALLSQKTKPTSVQRKAPEYEGIHETPEYVQQAEGTETAEVSVTRRPNPYRPTRSSTSRGKPAKGGPSKKRSSKTGGKAKAKSRARSKVSPKDKGKPKRH